MRTEERQKLIEDYLQKREFASLDELAGHVAASISTVRRDVTALEEAGTVRRTHGGARIVNPRSDEYAFSARDARQVAEKEAIGRACAELISSNQTVILDAGTTVYHVARHLENKRPQIITNSLPVANLFSSSSQTEVIVSGGIIYPRLGVLMGPLAVQTFSHARADVAIMSASGITLDGIANSHALLIEMQRAMIEAAQRVIFCFDHTKLNRQSMFPLCGLDSVDVIVTDSAAPAEFVEALRGRGMEVVVAPRSEE
jgi:DeoR/GlpR family transcriptional regulator of sugar metabolism